MSDENDNKSLRKRLIPQKGLEFDWGENLISRIYRTFISEQANADLDNKVLELHPVAKEIRQDLEKIVSEFQKEEDIYPYVKEVVDPLIREVDQIQSTLNKDKTELALVKYTQWTEKASLWVHLCSKAGDKERLTRLITHNILEKCAEIIDRDIQLIEKYLHTATNDELKQKQIASELAPIIQSLQTLKRSQLKLKLSEVSDWKKHFDLERSRLVNSALLIIDRI